MEAANNAGVDLTWDYYLAAVKKLEEMEEMCIRDRDVLGLVAVQSHLGAAGLGLVPGDDAPPRPAGNLHHVARQSRLNKRAIRG